MTKMLIVMLLTDAQNNAATNRRLVTLIGIESVSCIIVLGISRLYSA